MTTTNYTHNHGIQAVAHEWPYDKKPTHVATILDFSSMDPPKLHSYFALHIEKWDDTRYSYLSRFDRKIDLFLTVLTTAEFLVFLLSDSDKFAKIYSERNISFNLYYGLLTTYLFERIVFAIHRAFLHKREPCVAEGLAVFFLGPHLHWYKSYPYESRKRALNRQKLELFSLFLNISKIGMLWYIVVKKNVDVFKILYVVAALSCVEACFTIKDTFYFFLNWPLAPYARDYFPDATETGPTQDEREEIEYLEKIRRVEAGRSQFTVVELGKKPTVMDRMKKVIPRRHTAM
jgi:hypothetical protein